MVNQKNVEAEETMSVQNWMRKNISLKNINIYIWTKEKSFIIFLFLITHLLIDDWNLWKESNWFNCSMDQFLKIDLGKSIFCTKLFWSQHIKNFRESMRILFWIQLGLFMQDGAELLAFLWGSILPLTWMRA